MSISSEAVARNYFGNKLLRHKVDYDANSNLIYEGFAPYGALTSANLCSST